MLEIQHCKQSHVTIQYTLNVQLNWNSMCTALSYVHTANQINSNVTIIKIPRPSSTDQTLHAITQLLLITN